MEHHSGPRVNPRIERLVCSASGRVVDSHGFARPVGLCACCPPPGKPVVVEYRLARGPLPPARRIGDAVAEHFDGRGAEAVEPLRVVLDGRTT